MKTQKTVLLALMLALATTAMAAQVYKWKDAEGRVHYSDVPPMPGQAKPEVVNTSEMPVSSIATTKAPSARSASQASEVQAASAPAVQQQKDPKICQQAKSRKAFLQSGQMARTVNDKGEVEYLSAEKRKAEIAEADKAIKTFCP